MTCVTWCLLHLTVHLLPCLSSILLSRTGLSAVSSGLRTFALFLSSAWTVYPRSWNSLLHCFLPTSLNYPHHVGLSFQPLKISYTRAAAHVREHSQYFWWVPSACNAEDVGSVPRLGRSPGGGNGSPLQYSCLENPMDRGAWQAMVNGVTKSRPDLVTKQQQH